MFGRDILHLVPGFFIWMPKLGFAFHKSSELFKIVKKQLNGVFDLLNWIPAIAQLPNDRV